MLDQTTNLSSLLKDPSLLETRAYVNGAWIDGDDGTFSVDNPARGDTIAEVADLSRAQVAEAISAAEKAQKDWAKWTGKERAAVLRKWFDLMMENQDDLATILTAEQGKPLAEAKGEIAYGASFIEFFSEEAKRVYGETIPGHQRDKRIMVMKQPIGVVGSITPWNFPNAMITRKAGPALAAGCSFVARPAAETPLSAIVLGVLAERAGIPAGVLNIVPSSSSSEVGKEMCENPAVRKLTFTFHLMDRSHRLPAGPLQRICSDLPPRNLKPPEGYGFRFRGGRSCATRHPRTRDFITDTTSCGPRNTGIKFCRGQCVSGSEKLSSRPARNSASIS